MDERTIAVLLVMAFAAATGLIVTRTRRVARTAQRREHAVRQELERAEADRELLASEAERLREALVRADLGMLVVDQQGVVRFANPTGERFLGARHGEAVAEVRIRQLLETCLASHRAVTQELDLYTPVRRALRLRAAPFGNADPSVVLYIEDLTEGRRVDEVRRDFVANVGHELRTPIAALSVLAETLAGSLDDPEAARRLADRLSVEADRLGTLVGELLDLSEVESRPAAEDRLSVGDVVEDAVARLGVRHLREEIEIEAQIPPEVEVRGDRRQLVSALFNLLDNAVKYSDRPGTVRVRARTVGDRVLIEIEDQGVGIPASQLDRIFERFYRVDPGRSRVTGGTGLGLAIVKHVAINHGGTVSVESEEGKGSLFRLDLPAPHG